MAAHLVEPDDRAAEERLIEAAAAGACRARRSAAARCGTWRDRRASASAARYRAPAALGRARTAADALVAVEVARRAARARWPPRRTSGSRSAAWKHRRRARPPLRDDHRGDAVADAVGQGAALAHDPVDADHERDADRDRLRAEERAAERLQRAISVTRPAPGCRGALRGEDHQPGERELLADRHVLPRRLDDEQRAHREVDARAVEIERVAVGITRPTLWRDAPAASSLASSRGSTVSDEEVPTRISSSSRIMRMKRMTLKPLTRDRPRMPNTKNAQVRPEGDHQQAEARQRGRAEDGDRVGHAAERADRRRPTSRAG